VKKGYGLILMLVGVASGCASVSPIRSEAHLAAFQGAAVSERMIDQQEVPFGPPVISLLKSPQGTAAELAVKVERELLLVKTVSFSYQQMERVRVATCELRGDWRKALSATLAVPVFGTTEIAIYAYKRKYANYAAATGKTPPDMLGGYTVSIEEQDRAIPGEFIEVTDTVEESLGYKACVGYPMRVELEDQPSSCVSGVTDHNGSFETDVRELLKHSVGSGNVLLRVVSGEGNDKGEEFIELDEFTVAGIVRKVPIDNSVGRSELPPYATASSQLVQSGAVAAGETLHVSATVANTGKGDVCRLLAEAESDWGPMNGQKIYFGRIPPGESITRELEVEVPQLERSGGYEVRLVFSEHNGYEPDPVSLKFWIEGLPRPAFAYSLQVIDDNTGNSVGNGDGRIQKGEAVDLEITVRNVGEGVAEDVTVELSGISAPGLTVNVRERQLGDLDVGESRSARLTLSTTKRAAVERIAGELSIVERSFDVAVRDSLELPLDTAIPPRMVGLNRPVHVTSEDAGMWSGAGTDTPLIAKVKKGTVLTATAELPGWIRVSLPDSKTGWLRDEDVSFDEPAVAGAQVAVEKGLVTLLQKNPPLIVVSTPVDGNVVNHASVTFEGVIADDQGVCRYEIIFNGEVMSGAGKAITVVGKGSSMRERRFSRAVTLHEGSNRLGVRAWDTDGLEASRTIEVTYSKPKGKLYVAVIGISDYSGVQKLKYAVNDARSFAEYIREQLGVPAENVFTLYDTEATALAVRTLLGTTLARKAGKEGSVIIYFSGHGAVEPDETSPDSDALQKYLLPVDADSKNLFATALSMDTIATIFQRLKAQRVVFLADTCYSGAAGGKTVATGLYRATIADDFLRRLAKGRGRVVVTASGPNELALEKDELGHGVFTYYLLEALKGAADNDGDGLVSLLEAYQYVARQVPEETGQTQTPTWRGELEGELFLGKAEASAGALAE